jgi:hypothetical protein
MADDIEAFLKRAAQRRQAAANAQPSAPPTPPRPPKPEYTNSRTERLAKPFAAQEEPVLEAEIVYDENPANLIVDQADERMAEHIQQSFTSDIGQFSPTDSAGAKTNVTSAGVSELAKLLQQTDGLKMAVLLREVLDRPTHRW